MKKSIVRIVAGTAVALAAVAVTGGIASAAPAAPTPTATTSSDTPIWLIPGVDLGSILDPTIGIPAQVFAPVDGLLNYIGG